MALLESTRRSATRESNFCCDTSLASGFRLITFFSSSTLPAQTKTGDISTTGKALGTRGELAGGFGIERELTDGEERAGAVVVLVDDGRAASEEVDGPRPVHHLRRLGGRLGRLGLGIHLRRARRGHRRGEVGRGIGRHVWISHAIPGARKSPEP